MEKVSFSIFLLFAFMSLGFTEEGKEFLKSMVQIFNECDSKPKLKCVGVLINKNYTVTSANCVYGSSSSCLNAKIGNEKKPIEDNQRKITKIIIHPFHLRGSPDYDVAVLKIESNEKERIGFSLPHENVRLDPNTQVKVVKFKDEKFKVDNGLVTDRETCQNKHNEIFISKRIICIQTSFPTVGGYPVFFKQNENENHILIGIATTISQSKISPNLFANIGHSDIYSFLETFA